MSITVKLYLLKRRQKANGEIPIYIRITQNRRYSLLSSGISIEEKHWNPDKERVRKSHPSSKALNNRLERKLIEIQQLIDEAGEGIDRKQLVKMIRGGGRNDIYSYGISYADKLLKEGKYHPHKQTRSALNHFKEFAGKDARFNEVTPQMLNDYQRWLKLEKGHHPNTILKQIGLMKAVFTEAYQNDLTTNLPFNDPKFQKVKAVGTKKQALTFEQIKAIEALQLEGELFDVRNYFMFSFWNAGIRATDLILMRWSNIVDGRLIYTMRKNGKEKNIKLLPEAIKILDYYRDVETVEDFIFPIIKHKNLTEVGLKKKAESANTMINRRLKEIQKLAGIQTNITTHIARHSFARWAKENKMDIDFIGKALAHGDRSTTERYLNSLEEYNIDEEMVKLAKLANGKK